MKDKPTIFVSAAEASGDEHAARLIVALRERLAGARFVGVGGQKMREAGCELLEDLTARASMLTSAILRFPRYYLAVRRIQRAIAQIKPDLHIPVDSPALNWHLAGAARKAGALVSYHIAPQVWAWAPWRVKKLRRLTDQVTCLLPFEQEYLRSRRVNATYVGHPLFDDMPDRPSPMPDLSEAWNKGTWRVALLPGSRPAEMAAHAGAMLDAASSIARRWGKARFTMAARTEACAERLRAIVGQNPRVQIAVGQTRQVLADSHFCIVASGTATLEVAYFGVPMVVMYRVNRVLYNAVGRWLICTPRLSLVNILAGRGLVPELMPWFGNTKLLARTAIEAMDDLGWLVETRQKLIELTGSLRAAPPQTASGVAAEMIVGLLER